MKNLDKKKELIAKKMASGKAHKRYENEANPEMHSVKNSMRRKGFSDSKI